MRRDTHTLTQTRKFHEYNTRYSSIAQTSNQIHLTTCSVQTDPIKR